MVAAKNTTVLYQEAVRLQGLGRDRAKSGGFEDGGSAARRLDLGGRGSEAGGSISGMGISGGRVSCKENKNTNRYNGNLMYYVIWWEGKTVQ
jgi:hypothetical protein